MTFDLNKLDELPSRLSMTPIGISSRHNSFPESAAALRFLQSKVGQVWNDVYSEFVQKFQPRDRTSQEIVKWWVETNTFMKDGKVYCYVQYRNIDAIPIEESYYKMYVHPETFTLEGVVKKKRNYKKEREDEQAKWCRIIGPYRQYQKIDGIWYEVWIEHMEGRKWVIAPRWRLGMPRPNEPIKIDRGTIPIDWWHYLNEGGGPIGECPRIRKRQLSSKEKKKNGLT